ncbi:YhdT family protein [Halobacillus litoralis]|uniref:YhdT family protein n=1 Tax=Halobacillus litoralis TaxID=45668 RepID=UPI001CFD4764|nr:YhdT family protein [Halobacillus litoralis]
MKQKKALRDDPRYRVANREALIGAGLVLLNFIMWFGFAYGLGSKPVEEYQYIWGMPAWFFYSCIVTTISIITLVVLAVVFLFKEVPLDEEGDEQ